MSGPESRSMLMVDRLEREVAAALDRAGYSSNNAQGYTSLVVGVSGGADSTCLITCLSRIKEAHRLRLHVAHLNHNIRGEEAYEDARFVSDLAQELGLEATIEERNVVTYQKERRISSPDQPHAAKGVGGHNDGHRPGALHSQQRLWPGPPSHAC